MELKGRSIDLIQLILIDEKVYEPMASVRTRYPNVLELDMKKERRS